MLKSCIIALVVTTGFFVTSPQKDTLSASMKRGAQVYATNCQSCHMPAGEGIAGTFPPLAKSDYLLQDQKRAIGVVLHGASGEMMVNGETYNMDMPPMNYLTDQEVTDVLNFVQNNWGNKARALTPEQVKAVRQQKK
ncbi:c-type cytochrome [Pontibacter beigongshangensis]|uniref:c-type cytochrome n=1 Tax=Pontibacter beigongshangensis TaxID=2574733 RepID=UPI0016504AB6|nr:cytochrome c [Pontibacter beigongshangensis]